MVIRAVLPWALAAGATLLLTRELSPPPRDDSAVTPPPPASSEPRKDKDSDKDEVVYEPWEPVST